jgi:hypothetical protein
MLMPFLWLMLKKVTAPARHAAVNFPKYRSKAENLLLEMDSSDRSLLSPKRL